MKSLYISVTILCFLSPRGGEVTFFRTVGRLEMLGFGGFCFWEGLFHLEEGAITH